MKNFFSNIIKKVKNFVANLTPATKLRYVIITALTLLICASLVIVTAFNTGTPETPEKPVEVVGDEVTEIDFDTELIFDFGDESDTYTFAVSDESTAETSADISEPEEITTEDDTTETESTEVLDPITESGSVPTTPSEYYVDHNDSCYNDYEEDESPEASSYQPSYNPTPVITEGSKETDYKPVETTSKQVETTTKAIETEPKPLVTTTQSPETELKPVETTTAKQETPPIVSGKFSVKAKKYDYKGANVSIVSVESNSEQAHKITITGDFKDSNGEVIWSESKTFEGFPAGWKNYFVFQPGIKYDSVSWGLKAEAYEGDTYAEGIIVDGKAESLLIPAFGDGNGNVLYSPPTKDSPIVVCVGTNLSSKFYYNGNGLLRIKTHFVTWDANGNIINISNVRTIGNIQPDGLWGQGGGSVLLFSTDYLWEDRDKYVIPEYLHNVTMIEAVIAVEEY